MSDTLTIYSALSTHQTHQPLADESHLDGLCACLLRDEIDHTHHPLLVLAQQAASELLELGLRHPRRLVHGEALPRDEVRAGEAFAPISSDDLVRHDGVQLPVHLLDGGAAQRTARGATTGQRVVDARGVEVAVLARAQHHAGAVSGEVVEADAAAAHDGDEDEDDGGSGEEKKQKTTAVRGSREARRGHRQPRLVQDHHEWKSRRRRRHRWWEAAILLSQSFLLTSSEGTAAGDWLAAIPLAPP